MNQHVMLIASASALLFLGLVWTQKGWFNLLIKVALFAIGVLDIVSLLQ